MEGLTPLYRLESLEAPLLAEEVDSCLFDVMTPTEVIAADISLSQLCGAVKQKLRVKYREYQCYPKHVQPQALIRSGVIAL